MHFNTFLFLFQISVLLHVSNSENASENHTKIVNTQLEVLTESLINMKVSRFQQLFDQKKVDMESIFQPDFLSPNNVFASMGDSTFKNSLKIFTLFEPTTSPESHIQALVTISYRLGDNQHKMEKEVTLARDILSPTGYVFIGFKNV